jgi:hypothetical protein
VGVNRRDREATCRERPRGESLSAANIKSRAVRGQDAEQFAEVINGVVPTLGVWNMRTHEKSRCIMATP